MKRAVIAAASLALSLAICIASFITLSRTCKSLAPPLREISRYAQQGDSERAYEKAKEFEELWEKKHGRIEALIRHEEIDELEEIIKSLPVLARQGSTKRLEEQAESAVDRLDHIIDNEIPLISNIF